MKKYQLGEFEEIVLLTIAILHKGAYGVAIKEEIESRLARDVSMGALHAAWYGWKIRDISNPTWAKAQKIGLAGLDAIFK